MSPDTALHTNLLLSLLVIGGAGGFLSGLLGIGGGLIFVPALYFCLTTFGVAVGPAMHVAVGTSLALVLATGISSSFWHHKKGSIDAAILRGWVPFVVGGVLAGTFFASGVDGVFLKQMFAFVTLFIAAYVAFSREPEKEPAVHRVSKKIQKTVAAGIGVSAAMIGIGGAILSIPFMTYIGVPMRKAVGTGAALGSAAALPGMLGYMLSGLPHIQELPPYSLGYVNLLAAAVIIPVTMLLSPMGVHVSHTLPKILLRRIFAVVLILVSIRMFIA